MVKRRQPAKSEASAVRLVHRGQALVVDQEPLRLWADGLDLLRFALGVLADAHLRPGADDSLIARGNLLALGSAHSRLAKDGLAAGLFEPSYFLIREQIAIWRRIALARLSPEGDVDSGSSRRLRKRLDHAIERSGSDLDAEFASLAREGARTLRAAIRRDRKRPSSGPFGSSTQFKVGARWGVIVLGLFLSEAGQLGLMTPEWRGRTGSWEEQLGQWLQSQSLSA